MLRLIILGMQPCWGSIEQNFFSKNLHENRIQFPEERNPFVLDRQHGRRDVTCKPAIHMGILFMGVWVGEGGFVLNLVSLVLELRGSKRSTIAVYSCPVRFKPRWTRATGPEYFLAVVLCRNNIQEIFKRILMVVVYWCHCTNWIRHYILESLHKMRKSNPDI